MTPKLLMPTLFFFSSISAFSEALTIDQQANLEAAFNTGNKFVIQATVDALLLSDPKADVNAALTLLENPIVTAKVDGKSQKKTSLFDLSAWEGEASLGIELKSGNTDRETYETGVSLKRDAEVWAVQLGFSGKNAHESNIRTEEEYKASIEGRYKLDNHRFVFGDADWVEDPFDSYSTRFSETIGYGESVIKNDVMQLDFKGSIGGRHAKPNVENAAYEHEIVVKPGIDFSWKLRDGVELTENFESTIGEEFVLTVSETALKTKMFDNFYLKLAFEIEHNSEQEEERQQTDTETTVKVVYGF